MATAKVLEKNSIGYRIRTLRTEKKLTQKQLCERVHISHGSMSNYETGTNVPDDIVEALARELGVTASYLKGIDPVKQAPKTDPQPLKTALKNHEGYIDTTAQKAVAIVMSNSSLNTPYMVGDVVSANSNVRAEQVLYVILAIVGKRVWVSELSKTVFDDNNYVYTIRNGAQVYYADISKVTTRYTDSLKKKLFTTPEFTMSKISDRFKGCMFPMSEFLKAANPAPVAIEKVEEKTEEPDEISKVFTDSISYFNEKNDTSIEAPKGIVTLQQAIDISDKAGIPLSEFIKDHTEDRVLDEICKYEAKIAELKAKIGL